MWSAQDTKEKLENLIVIRTTFLAPFLFGEQTFCDEVRSLGSVCGTTSVVRWAESNQAEMLVIQSQSSSDMR